MGRILLVLANLVATGTAWADYTSAEQSVTVTGYTGQVIDADATRPGAPGRSVIVGSAALRYIRSSGVGADSVNYTLTWSLVDADGMAQALDSGGSSVNAIQPVSWTAGVTEVTQTATVNLDPGVQLDRAKLYRVKVTATPVGGATATYHAFPLSFSHFTNTVSNDTALNIIGTVPFATLNQDWVILSPTLTGPTLTATVVAGRYDEFDLPVATTDITLRLRAVVTDVTIPGAPVNVPMVPDSMTQTLSIANHTADDKPAAANANMPLMLNASSFSGSAMYQVTAIIEYLDGNGSYVQIGQKALAAQRIVPLSGVLKFGGITTHFTTITGQPQPSGGNSDLGIPAGQGYLEDHPDITFGGNFIVSFDANHDATVIIGTATLPPSTSQIGPAEAKVRVKREGVVLSSAGAVANKITVYFPAGFTVCVPAVILAPATEPVLENNASGKAVLLNQALTSALLPSGSVSLSYLDVRRGAHPDATTAHTMFYCCHERLPAWFKASSVTWNTGTGEFVITPSGSGEWRSVRDKEMAVVEDLHLPATDPPLHAADTRPSNDTFLRRAHLTYTLYARSFGIKADANGLALLSAHVPLENTTVRPHYPMGTQDFSFVAGTIDFVDNVLNAVTSKLTSVTSLTQRYEVNPRSSTCDILKSDPLKLTIQPTANTLRFTDELGLIGSGALIPENAPSWSGLSWGVVDKLGLDDNNQPAFRFAHQTSNFTTGTYYMPGIALPGGAAALNNDHRPGTLLLSGREKPDSLTYVERPGAANDAYHVQGLANYAGLNLRVEPPGMTGTSLIAGQLLADYPLNSASKYYVQQGGVTGMHMRTTSQAPITVSCFGLPMTLSDFKFSYRDNQVWDSICAGSVVIPLPVGVTQPFSKLTLNERGQPTNVELPSGPQINYLSYWGGVEFRSHGMTFRAKTATAQCELPAVDAGFLEMGVTFPDLAHGIIPVPVHGTLGFKVVNGRGELVTLQDRLGNGVAKGTEVDSRLILPPNLRIQAQGGQSYTLTPLTTAYFNSTEGANVNATDGFLAFAGKLAVPFFAEVPVHVHLSPGSAGSVYFMGGYKDGYGRTPFTDPGTFDTNQIGYPTDNTLAHYRQGVGNPATLLEMHAKKTWLDVVDFDFALSWDPSFKRFASAHPETKTIVLFDINQNLKSLTANGAEIEFGAELPLLPQINPQRLLLDALDGVSGGALTQFDTALKAASGNFANATHITDAVSAADELITDRVDRLIDDALTTPMNELITQALNEANAAAALAGGDEENQRAAFVQTLKTQLSSVALLQTKLTAAVNGLSQQVRATGGQIDKMKVGVVRLRDIIKRTEPTGNKRGVFRELTRLLLQNVDHHSLIDVAGGLLAQQLGELEDVQQFQANPFFDDLDRVLADVELQLTNLKASTQLLKPVTDWIGVAPNLATINNSLTTQLEQQLQLLLPANGSTLRDISGPASQNFRDKLRRTLMEASGASPLAGRIQLILRNSFTPVRGKLREGMDQILSQITTTIKEAFLKQLEVGDPNGNPLSTLTDVDSAVRGLNDTLKGAHLRGYARTVGNSISELRLDGGIKFAPPGMGAGMEFSGYFIYRDAHSIGPSVDCMNVAAGAAVEVIVGARLGSKSKPQPNPNANEDSTSFFDNMAVGADFHFALDSHGEPLGFSGDLDLRGPLDVGIVSIDGVRLQANFSADNQFIVGTANGRILEVIKADVDVFAGHTCDLSKLGVLNGPLQSALNQASFSGNGQIDAGKFAGVVCRIKGSISVNDIIKRFGTVDIPRKLVDIGLAKETIYAVLLKPNDPLKFYLGYSEGGRLSAKTAGYTLAEVNLTIAGVAQAELTLKNLALCVVGPEGLLTSLTIKGEGSLDGPVLGYPKLRAKFGGHLYRTGIDFDGFDWSLLAIPDPF